MASSPSFHGKYSLELFHSFTILVALLNSAPLALSCYTSIFSFGDSLTDAGNALYDHISGFTGKVYPPYGMTYFHHPAGRFSNGRLIVDFIDECPNMQPLFWPHTKAEKLGLPFPPPYLVPGKNFSQGANFAVAGATALGPSFFEERGIYISMTNNSLGIQLEWFEQLLHSLCSSQSDCENFLGNSLILMGEIGGNDLSFPLLGNHSLDEIQTFMPMVVNVIASAITKVIEHGARTILVPGNLPIGCLPAYLNKFKNDSIAEDYDPRTGCLRHVNELMEKYNGLLKRKLHRLRALHPNATILYADFYNAAMPLYISPSKYGFGNGTVLRACCGQGGPYNFNTSAICGTGLENLCSDPSTYFCWDGLHPTEAAYQFIANRVMEVSYFSNTSCLSSLQKDGSHKLI